MLQYLFQSPLLFFCVATALVISLAIHEFAHALVAYRLGDPTAKYAGRVTLNPLAHLDPMGTLFILVAGFGWGKPVPINTLNFRHPKRDGALVALAGPLSNFLLAILVGLLFRVLVPILGAESFGSVFLYLVVLYNLFLGTFNLLPFGPLDGFKVVEGFLPWHLVGQWRETERWGLLLLIFLVFTGATSNLIAPVVRLFVGILLQL